MRSIETDGAPAGGPRVARDVRSIAAALGIGSIGLLSIGMQPLMLVALVAEHRIADGAVGAIAAVEVVAIAIGSLVGLRLLRRISATILALLAAAGFAATGLVLILAQLGTTILIDRMAAGLCEGMMVSVALVTVAAAARPERLSAIFVTGQTILQLLGALAVPWLPWPRLVSDKGYALLVAASLVVACLAFSVAPPRETAATVDRGRPISRASKAALVASGAYQGGFIAVWVHLGLWAGDAGFSQAAASRIVALALLCQILGGAAAARWSGRISNKGVILTASAVQIASTLLLVAAPVAAPAAYGWSALFFGLAMFTVPSFTGLLVELDPQRLAVTYTAAAQLIGAAAVPALASLFVRPGAAGGALLTGCGALALNGALVLAALRLARRGPRKTDRL